MSGSGASDSAFNPSALGIFHRSFKSNFRPLSVSFIPKISLNRGADSRNRIWVPDLALDIRSARLPQTTSLVLLPQFRAQLFTEDLIFPRRARILSSHTPPQLTTSFTVAQFNAKKVFGFGRGGRDS